MTVAKQQHAKECERQHHSEGLLMEQLGRLLGEFKASARYACPAAPLLTSLTKTSWPFVASAESLPVVSLPGIPAVMQQGSFGKYDEHVCSTSILLSGGERFAVHPSAGCGWLPSTPMCTLKSV